MIPVLIAQFLSALADNMLLFVILGLLKQQVAPEWVSPILQQAFLLSFIVLAPFVGALSDRFAKGRVMLLANTLKCLAVGYLLVGGNVFIAYALVGIGASIYSPAKYGILKEIKGEAFLVKANALIEGSTIAAILIGVVLGGILADYAAIYDRFGAVIALIMGIYVVASVSNLFIPKLAPQSTAPLQPLKLAGEFVSDFKTLWADFGARLSLMGTSLFFGVGATMRFLLIAWVPLALGIDDNKTPAILNAVVAIGIVVGSGLASKIPMSQAHRVLSAGIGMGIGVICLSLTTNINMAYMWLILTGVCGGLFLVPLNAVLQKQGHALIGGGRAVAIQNFGENITMLVMLSLYMGLSKTGISPVSIGIAFGVLVAILMISLRLYGYAHYKKAH